MKKFLLNFLFFIGAVFFLSCFVDYRISCFLRESQHCLHSCWNDFHRDSLGNDLIINGNSRALLQYNPYILDSLLNVNSYNFGFDGSAINRQIIKYQAYCRLQHHRPEVLVQNIDFVTMAITKGIDREQFFPYFIFDRQMIRDFDEYEGFSFFEKYIPCFRYIGYPELVQSSFGLNRMYVHPGYKGFVYNESEYDGSQLSQIDTIDYCQDPKAIGLFDKFLFEETEAGVKIIFVYAPIYIDATKKMNNIAGMYQMYDSLAQKHNIPIIDYTFGPICNDSSYFYNAMHLNKMGADLFSRELAYDIDPIIRVN